MGTTTVAGLISARAGSPGLATAAGGSIFVTSGWLEGAGVLDVSSPDFTPASPQYGGGGGRIAVVLSRGMSFGSVSMRAYGCYPGRTVPYPGAAGTLFTRRADQGVGYGTIRVDNRGVQTSTNITTPIPPDVSVDPALSVRYVVLVVTNAARAEIAQDVTLGDLYLCDDTSRLHLNGHTLTLRAQYHPDWGTTNRVVYDGGRIIWTQPESILLQIF